MKELNSTPPVSALSTERLPVSNHTRPKNSQTKMPLNEAEQQAIEKLKTIDRHVRKHEQKHLAAAGPYAFGGISFRYRMGPDGRPYAIGGEVHIDLNPVPNNPQATITKARRIKKAALAPSEPSKADRAVAAAAAQMEKQARIELDEKGANSNHPKKANNSHPNTKRIFSSGWRQPGSAFDRIV